MKPYFEDESVTIYHGDCREVLPSLPRADLVFADPPYGIGKAEWDSEFPVEVIPMMLQAGKTLAITPGETAFRQCLIALGDTYQGMMIGHNLNGMALGEIGFLSYVAILIAGDRPRYHGKTAFDYVISGSIPEHPASKPLRFMNWIISRLCMSGDLVIDPFMGSGTTLRAAKDLGIKAIGIEIEERYCEIAAKRMAQQVLTFDDVVTQPQQLSVLQ